MAMFSGAYLASLTNAASIRAPRYRKAEKTRESAFAPSMAGGRPGGPGRGRAGPGRCGGQRDLDARAAVGELQQVPGRTTIEDEGRRVPAADGCWVLQEAAMGGSMSPRMWILALERPGEQGGALRSPGSLPEARGPGRRSIAQAARRPSWRRRRSRCAPGSAPSASERVPPAPARRAQRREKALLQDLAVFGVEPPRQVTTGDRPDAAQSAPSRRTRPATRTRLFQRRRPSPLEGPREHGQGGPRGYSETRATSGPRQAHRDSWLRRPSGAGRRFIGGDADLPPNWPRFSSQEPRG